MKREYKQTEVGIIPEEWVVKSLGEIGEALIGLTYKPIDVREYGTLVLRSSNIQNDALAFEDNVFVDTAIPERIKVRTDDVLICVRNGSRDLIGKSALLDERTKGMTFGAFMAVYRSQIGKLVSYIFQSAILKRQINGHLGATINQITNKSLNSFRIPLPPTEPEQRAIATALSDVDGLIDSLTRLIVKKRNIKKAVMQQLLTGQLRLPGFCGEWEVKILGDIATIAKGTQLHSSEACPDGHFPHFNGGILPSSYTHKFNAPANTIAISEGGNSCGYVQLVSQPFWCGGHCYAVVPKSVDNQFLFHALKGRQNVIQGLRVGSGLPNVQKTALAGFCIRIPSNTKEQVAIAEVLSDMDGEIFALEKRLAKTKNIKKTMMQELLTGKTRLV